LINKVMIAELKTFLAVVKYGTFGRAASQVGLTQSAVSAQIQRLEQELGFFLFERTGRSALLNDAGRQTIITANELLAVYARMGSRPNAAGSAGILRIGSIASAQTTILVGAIERFRAQLPGWQVKVIPGVSLNLLAELDTGELDAALIIKPSFALPAEIRWSTLACERFVLLAPRSLVAVGWRHLLSSQPFIRYDRGSFGGRLVSRFLKKQRLTVNHVVELDELQGIVALVERGVGVALVPLSTSIRIPASLAAIDLEADSFYREIGVARREAGSERAATVNFVNCLDTYEAAN
jgi:DNA-binding transcriptional LysR family regulator